VVDYGVKRNQLRALRSRGAEVILVRQDATLDDVMAHSPSGVVLSNGPGDPARIPHAVELCRGLLERRVPLVIAHDWADAERRTPLTLTEALDAFMTPPLDRVEIDLDIKLPGREEEIVAGLQERQLVGRAMVSTMELYSLARIRDLDPELRRGWTYPKVTKDWTSKRWAKGPMLAALVAMRHRLPGLAAQELPKLGVESMWVYHPLVTRRLARIAEIARVELIAWTVDDPARMRKLVEAGVTGLCSNDPRLFARL